MDHKHLAEYIDESGLFLCAITPDGLRRALTLDLNSKDVIIASYPKSGNMICTSDSHCFCGRVELVNQLH